jgi:hypothetical protein
MDAYRTAPDILKIKLSIADLILTFSAGDTESAQEKAMKAYQIYHKHKDISQSDAAFMEWMRLWDGMDSGKTGQRAEKLLQQIMTSEPEAEDIIEYRQWLRIFNC